MIKKRTWTETTAMQQLEDDGVEKNGRLLKIPPERLKGLKACSAFSYLRSIGYAVYFIPQGGDSR